MKWALIQPAPTVRVLRENLLQHFRRGWLKKIFCCAKLHRPFTVAVFGRRSQNKDTDVSQKRLVAHPFEHFKSMDIGKFETEKNAVGQRMCRAVPKSAAAAEIIKRLTAVHGDMHWLRQFGLGQCAFHQEHIVFVILYQKNTARSHAGFCEYSSPGESSIQKLLPLMPSDSTPARPPIFSTALRTMARPMPVPS